MLSPYEKVTATATGGFWLGLLGLGAAGVYFVIRELLPKYVLYTIGVVTLLVVPEVNER